jgi:Gamma-butyrobetaine hydroxylase-like, N-terminal
VWRRDELVSILPTKKMTRHIRALRVSSLLARPLITAPKCISPILFRGIVTRSSQPVLSLPPDTPFRLEMHVSDINLEINSSPVSFDRYFLRDSCPCPKCIDPSTQQKLISMGSLPANLWVRTIKVKESGCLEVVWGENERGKHVSKYPAEWLWRYADQERLRRWRFPGGWMRYWDGEMMRKNNLRVEYSKMVDDDEVLHKVLMQLHLFGLVFIENVPSESTDGGEVETLARRIGEVKSTFYGPTWDVKATPNSKNIAYPPSTPLTPATPPSIWVSTWT